MTDNEIYDGAMNVYKNCNEQCIKMKKAFCFLESYKSMNLLARTLIWWWKNDTFVRDICNDNNLINEGDIVECFYSFVEEIFNCNDEEIFECISDSFLRSFGIGIRTLFLNPRYQ